MTYRSYSSAERPWHSLLSPPLHCLIMASLKIKHVIHFCRKGSLDWKVDISAEIPPSDDALKIQFAVFREIEHAYGPDSSIENNVVLEHISTLQSTYKAITIRPSELCSEDTNSIMQSYSVRSILDFVTAHYPPLDKEIMRPKIVTTIIKLVQNSINRVLSLAS